MAAVVVTHIRAIDRNGGVMTHIDENGETQFVWVDKPTAAYVLNGGQIDISTDVPEHERTGRLSYEFSVNAGFLPRIDLGF